MIAAPPFLTKSDSSSSRIIESQRNAAHQSPGETNSVAPPLFLALAVAVGGVWVDLKKGVAGYSGHSVAHRNCCEETSHTPLDLKPAIWIIAHAGEGKAAGKMTQTAHRYRATITGMLSTSRRNQ
jgi:hypothetical protein